jgi:GNAT superfamily N-acetyltransferase
MDVLPFSAEYVAEAVAIFVSSLERTRRLVPQLPDEMLDVRAVAERLDGMTGVVAIDRDGGLMGYLTSWFPISPFRHTDRAAAYSPEWGHGARGPDRRDTYRALYRAASADWSAAGCSVHAITLLEGDEASVDAWFWNGFGLATMDAVRDLAPVEAAPTPGIEVRAGGPADAGVLARLDAEHVHHYTQPPLLMGRPDALDAAGWAVFCERPGTSVWIAEDADDRPYGFMRFDSEFDAADVVASGRGVSITGAYVRPDRRRRGAATAMLDAGIRHHAAAGLSYCAVDFESFNPEAAGFWTRHFATVCSSLIRVPERP